ncbi:hypothetical protein [Thioalkalivibrio sp. ALE20]|uniref:hypothetical protein n=1 Tax=Thioalkalivibrio sp. ALE20 TaxID=545275 RepID=UPI0003772135|nr:hypothetical protein [Thioalkalivibrio sp. ALE20]
MPVGMFTQDLDALARETLRIEDPDYTIYAAAVRQLDEWRDDAEQPTVVAVELPTGFMRVSLAPTVQTDEHGTAVDWDVSRARHAIIQVPPDLPVSRPRTPGALPA